ncbi:hypothetical protein CDAR_40021 [Caerostris darwini]|uniref:Uncharacterized protein n=1 Tax=Caerostris darwini TaxID=1538125 RepID=A0AAV4RDL3_9ARAC|nr:hypothetical protein CDAR_40021 [Caerostris darwini]
MKTPLPQSVKTVDSITFRLKSLMQTSVDLSRCEAFLGAEEDERYKPLWTFDTNFYGHLIQTSMNLSHCEAFLGAEEEESVKFKEPQTEKGSPKLSP